MRKWFVLSLGFEHWRLCQWEFGDGSWGLGNQAVSDTEQNEMFTFLMQRFMKCSL